MNALIEYEITKIIDFSQIGKLMTIEHDAIIA